MTKEQAFAREALRALQKFDQVSSIANDQRQRLMAVQDDLGEIVGLDCTGALDMEGRYEHNGGTCPIHEWVDENDYALCESS